MNTEHPALTYNLLSPVLQKIADQVRGAKKEIMDDEALQELLQYLFDNLYQAECRIEALTEIVVDKKMVSEKEIELRVEQISREKQLRLKQEVAKRDILKQLSTRPKQ